MVTDRITANDSTNLDNPDTACGDDEFLPRRFADGRIPFTVSFVSQLPVTVFCCEIRRAVVSHNDAAAELWVI